MEVLKMAYCSKCGNELPEGVLFCAVCGAPVADSAVASPQYDAKDISENKVVAMLLYLTGVVGLVIALLMQKDSPYIQFHLRQCLKLLVVEALLGFAAAILCWTVIVPVAAGICLVILFVLHIIGFVQTCNGKAEELPIISKLNFLR